MYVRKATLDPVSWQIRVMAKSDIRKVRRQFVAYCPTCGWGFSAGANLSANFCPRCGINRRRSPESHAPDVRSRRPEAPLPSFGKVTRIEPKPTPLAGLRKAVVNHPIAMGAGAALTGAGMVCAAPAMAIAGASVVATGAAISSAGTTSGVIVSVVAMMLKEPKGVLMGASIAAGGLAVGGTIATAGGIVMAAGGAMAVGGGVLAYGGGAVAVGAGAKKLHDWERANGFIGAQITRLRRGSPKLSLADQDAHSSP